MLDTNQTIVKFDFFLISVILLLTEQEKNRL